MNMHRLGLAGLVFVACTEANPDATGETGSSTQTEGSTSGSASAATMTSATGNASESETASEDEDDTAPDSTTADSSATTADTTGEAACPIGTHLCMPAAPDGWLGPVAILEQPTSERDAECGDAYAIDATVAYDDLVAPEAVCDCVCGNPSALSCDVELVRDNSAGCGSPTIMWDIANSGCVEEVDGAAGSYWQASAPPPDGSCTETPSMDVAEAEFDARVRLCGASEPGPGVCEDGGVCAPIPVAPFGQQLCVYAEGELECPRDAGYELHRVVHRDLIDNRGCTTCSCSVEGECTGAVALVPSVDCGGEFSAGSVSINGSCYHANLGVGSALPSGFDIEATCEPTGGEAEGEAVGTDPVTICCPA